MASDQLPLTQEMGEGGGKEGEEEGKRKEK